MSKQIKQVYDAAPATSVLYNDLVYLGRSPYGVTDDRASLAKNAYPSLTNVVYASKGGDNTNNNGTEAFPYADPYAANTAITGTSTNPKRIVVAPGTYSTTTFAIKPHTTIDSAADAIFSLSGSMTLDASWSSETSAKFYCYNANISGTTDLDFTSTGAAFNIAKFYNTVFGGGATFSDDAQGNEFQFWNCEFTTATFKSTVPRINKCQFSSTFTVQPSAGTGNTTLFVRNSAYAGNVVLTGASGSGITATIYGSPILGSITINTTHVGLDIDEASYPQGGITYAGGATSAQVIVHRGDMGATTPYVKTDGKILRANNTSYVESTSTFADTYLVDTFLFATSANTITGLNITNAQIKLDSPILSNKNHFLTQNGVDPVAITSTAGSIAWNTTTAFNATHTMTENTTLANPTQQIDGFTYQLRIKQHASAAKTLAWGTDYKFPGGVAPILSTGLNAVDRFTFTYSSDSGFMECVGIAQNIG